MTKKKQKPLAASFPAQCSIDGVITDIAIITIKESDLPAAIERAAKAIFEYGYKHSWEDAEVYHEHYRNLARASFAAWLAASTMKKLEGME